MTGIPPQHAIVHDTPSETGATLVPAIQADSHLGAAKPSQPDGTGYRRTSYHVTACSSGGARTPAFCSAAFA